MRDYVRRGIVAAPEHKGREAVYRYWQLLQLVAARFLVADGWPLGKIAESFRHASEADLLRIVGVHVDDGEETPDTQDEDEPAAVRAGLVSALPEVPTLFDVRARQHGSKASDRFEESANRGFAEWGEVFGDPVVATAPLDRLLHHAAVIQIEGASYRLRQHANLVPEHVRSKSPHHTAAGTKTPRKAASKESQRSRKRLITDDTRTRRTREI